MKDWRGKWKWYGDGKESFPWYKIFKSLGNGLWLPIESCELAEAIDLIGNGKNTMAELYEIDEFITGDPSAEKIADVVNGKWILRNKKLDSKTIKESLKRGGWHDATEEFLG